MLKALAVEQGSSVAELVRQSVDSFLRQTAGATIEERRRRAIAAAGRFHSGRPDISVCHDDYLARDFDS
jgi:hypothetical protein